MSAAAQKVLGAFSAFMAEMAATDPAQWEPAEVVAFADGIEQISNVMQVAKAGVLANAEGT